ncbi:MAG: homoserine O-acetyltransferase, partial [Flavobacteriales bacterium]
PRWIARFSYNSIRMALKSHSIVNFQTQKGHHCNLVMTYQLFGEPLHTAPVVLVNHALTGNSSVTGKHGWWSALIGKDKAVDTDRFTILAIDIPGNGYGGSSKYIIENYKAFNNYDMARLQYEVIKSLKIKQLFAVVGGSLGGQIAWELAVSQPQLVQHLIPIASDWKATDWVVAQCCIQEQILHNSLKPIHDARMHAMTFYRTPASFKAKFQRSKTTDGSLYSIESWLLHHGKRLEERFSIHSYRLMNHLLGSADITAGVSEVRTVFESLQCKVHLVSIDSDGLFLADEIYDTYLKLQEANIASTYHEIKSIHGHDAFLIEYEQLETIIKPIFSNILCQQH